MRISNVETVDEALGLRDIAAAMNGDGACHLRRTRLGSCDHARELEGDCPQVKDRSGERAAAALAHDLAVAGLALHDPNPGIACEVGDGGCGDR